MIPDVAATACASADDFLLALRRSHSRWANRRTSTESAWIFRGQTWFHDLPASHHLIPSALRPPHKHSLFSRTRELLELTVGECDWLRWVRPDEDRPDDVSRDDWAERVQVTGLDAFTHATLVKEWIVLADDVRHGGARAGDLWHIGNQERVELRQYFHGQLMNDALALAQHHGVPTILLDWTYNSLVAAYFAALPFVCAPAAEAIEPGANDYIVVWALRRALLDLEHPYISRVTLPARVATFLDAQSGLFTWSPKTYSLRLRHNRYVPLDDLINAAAEDLKLSDVLTTVSIHASHASDVVRLLWREGISHAHLMPTLDNVTRALEMKTYWRLLANRPSAADSA